jgi:hypothetical protein
MNRVKLLKGYGKWEYDDYVSTLTPGVLHWVEMSDEELSELRKAVNMANRKYNRDFVYILIVDGDENSFIEEVFADAKEFLEYERSKAEKEEKRKKEPAAKRAATALERKRKQLEKLKKELGDE